MSPTTFKAVTFSVTSTENVYGINALNYTSSITREIYRPVCFGNNGSIILLACRTDIGGLSVQAKWWLEDTEVCVGAGSIHRHFQEQNTAFDLLHMILFVPFCNIFTESSIMMYGKIEYRHIDLTAKFTSPRLFQNRCTESEIRRSNST